MELMRCLFFAYRPFRLLAGGGWPASDFGRRRAPDGIYSPKAASARMSTRALDTAQSQAGLAIWPLAAWGFVCAAGAAARDGIVIFWHFASVLGRVLTVLEYVLTVLEYVLTVLGRVLTVIERVSAIFDCFAAGYVEGSGKISKCGAIAWRRGGVGCGAEIRAIESSRRYFAGCLG